MNLMRIITEFWPQLLSGVAMTLKLTFLGALIAGILAPMLALVRVNGGPLVQIPLRLYISFMRGTPLLAQMFLIYYGSGQFRPFLQDIGLWNFFREPFNCALLAFVLNSTAYQTEILRGGLLGVPHGEVEAATAVGMNRLTALRRVIFPHAYRIAWPALGNEIVLLMKASALASVITIFDLMGQTRAIFAKTFDFSVYIWAAILYLCLTATFVFVWRQLEVRLSPHIYRKRPAQASAVPRGKEA
jgi:polar amino acid transport system permease protein